LAVAVSKVCTQTFIEWAAQTVNKSFWAGAFYQQRGKGSSHQAALRALAFKWIRILFRCWKNRTPYDESKYLKALKKVVHRYSRYSAQRTRNQNWQKRERENP
jgi:hypothetical protein